MSLSNSELLEYLSASAILPSLASDMNEFSARYKMASQEIERQNMLPYADLLEEYIKSRLKDHSFQQGLLQQLRDSSPLLMEAKIFSWRTIYYNESLSSLLRREAIMTEEELKEHRALMAEREEEIRKNGWEDMFGLAYEYQDDSYPDINISSWSRKPVRVTRIFEKTNLQYRIAMALGPHFTPRLYPKFLEAHGDEETGFRLYEMVLSVIYHPFGLNPKYLMTFLKEVREDQERKEKDEKATLNDGEFLVMVPSRWDLPYKRKSANRLKECISICKKA